MPPKRKSAKSSSEPATKKSKADAGESSKSDKPKVKTMVVKGCAPVDSECPLSDTAHVYTAGSEIYDAMLNQTNLQFNNNKYYVIQLLQSDASSEFFVWFRWGRVGKSGQTKLEKHGNNVDKAIDSFAKKFYDKTRNTWSERKNFTKVKGKYDLLEIDYSSKNDDAASAASSGDGGPDDPKKDLKSKLADAVRTLIELICDIKVMQDTVVEMKYDCEKAPLGRLTKDQIKAGYQALKDIEQWIEKQKEAEGGKSKGGRKRSAGGSGAPPRADLVQACNDFYTRIPHDFGMRVPPLISSLVEVKEKLQLLEALGDIEIAMQIIKERGEKDEHPTDRHYKALECDLTPVSHTDKIFKMLNKYLLNTHASTHNTYSMELLDVFKCEKKGEADNFVDYGNKKLLWHGSRLSNWVGILSKGLRIAPPEAPATGYMFGKGVYFADMSSKSANYMYTSRMKNIGLLVLCEVSLGKSNQLLRADFRADRLPAGCHSVQGMGRIAPDANDFEMLDKDILVPYGKGVDTGVVNPTGYTLNYNEFIIYDTRQIRMRYLLKVKMNYR